MIYLDTEICICNSITARNIVECVQKHNMTTLDALLDNDICPMGDKCESCLDEGFHNDGINIPMALAMANKIK